MRYVVTLQQCKAKYRRERERATGDGRLRDVRVVCEIAKGAMIGHDEPRVDERAVRAALSCEFPHALPRASLPACKPKSRGVL